MRYSGHLILSLGPLCGYSDAYYYRLLYLLNILQSFEHVMYFVYIVETVDGTYYTGMTNDLARRLNEHVSNSARSASYLRMHKPAYVVHITECKTRGEAMKLEKRFKSDYIFKMEHIGPRRSILEVIDSELSYK
ncbi:MAG: GIY-YIG nuclease family protein [Candidatus Thorarchaeota archaeon]